MFRQQYRVKGEDVNDFMEMEKFAYRLYTISLIKTFLSKKGYSKKAVENFKTILEECSIQLAFQKNLIFTQDFFMYLDNFKVAKNEKELILNTRFFNAKNELCATLTMQNCD
ncbi:hypothetical protein [Flavivirga jejuensis]|uniref:Uncharacterized protein n=1 Tax=Flavivirga jejuensis TaxID=870487 RepID=A0ABT8WQL8_9FLAO|nr:hypothetical protein [Flavivirga jejuensis]MDO5975467.1 hypothetical protein [Flavivirga jejuensis]